MDWKLVPVHNNQETNMSTNSNTSTKLNKSQSSKYGNLPSKSARIRFLLKLGWSRRAVADRVGVIYQFVYNVEHQKAK